VKDSLGQGILTGGDGCRFVNLDVHDNGTDGLTHGIYLSAADCLIDGGRYWRNVGWGIHVYPKATNTVVRNTRCYENGATGLGLVWGSNNVAYNNVVYHNGSGIHLSGDSPRKSFEAPFEGPAVLHLKLQRSLNSAPAPSQGAGRRSAGG